MASQSLPPEVPRPIAPLNAWPLLDGFDRDAVEAVLSRGVLCRGPEVPSLEREWSNFTGAQHVVGVSSCTHALQVTLAALGVGPGEEVLVPAYTFIGTALPILHVGATPVFLDVDWQSCAPTIASICKAVTPRTRAMVPVHLHGIAVDVPGISAALGARNIVVVEDACQAHGTRLDGRHVGTLAHAGCFSLNAVKNLPAGQGGLVCTNDDRLADRIRGLASHGIEHDGVVVEAGFSFGLTEFAAAVARSQLRKLARHSAASRRNASIVSDALAGIPLVHPPVIPPGCEPSWHKYMIRLDLSCCQRERRMASVRDAVMDALREEGIPVELWQRRPLPTHPVFGGRSADEYPETTRLLDSSFILGTERHPLVAQSEAIVRHWSEVLRRVLATVPEIAMQRPCSQRHAVQGAKI